MHIKLVNGEGDTPSDAQATFNMEVLRLTRDGYRPHGTLVGLTTTYNTGATRKVVYSLVMIKPTEEEVEAYERAKGETERSHRSRRNL